MDDELYKFVHSIKYISEKLENRIPFETFTIEKLGLEKMEKGGPIDLASSGQNLLETANSGE